MVLFFFPFFFICSNSFLISNSKNAHSFLPKIFSVLIVAIITQLVKSQIIKHTKIDHFFFFLHVAFGDQNFSTAKAMQIGFGCLQISCCILRPLALNSPLLWGTVTSPKEQNRTLRHDTQNNFCPRKAQQPKNKSAEGRKENIFKITT